MQTAMGSWKYLATGQVDIEAINLTRVHLRLVRLNWEEELQATCQREWAIEFPSEIKSPAVFESESQRFCRFPAVRQWLVELGEADAKGVRRATLVLPGELEPGGYGLLASRDDRFQVVPEDESSLEVPSKTEYSYLSAIRFWASSLELILATDTSLSGIQGVVLNSQTGEPEAGAKIRVWKLGEKLEELSFPREIRSNDRGLFVIDLDDRWGAGWILAEKGGEACGVWSILNRHIAGAPSRNAWKESLAPEVVAWKFDRWTCRPGETVHFLGAVYRRDQQLLRPLAGREVTIDSRGAFAPIKAVTDEFGAFSGQFQIPQETDSSSFWLEARTQEGSQTTAISIEKPVTAQLKVDWNLTTPARRAAEKVGVAGVVRNSLGQAIESAEVKWRVELSASAEFWPGVGSWQEGGSSAVQTISGVRVTDDRGAFTFEFPCRPDPLFPAWRDPAWRFQVFVEAVDSQGNHAVCDRYFLQHHSDCTAELVADFDEVEAGQPIELQVATRNRQGLPAPVKGWLHVARIVPNVVDDQPFEFGATPEYSARRAAQAADGPDRFNSVVERVLAERDSRVGALPGSKRFENQVQVWACETDGKGLATRTIRLEAGDYVCMYEGRDKAGDACFASYRVSVRSSKGSLRKRGEFVLKARPARIERGATAELAWESGSGLLRGRFYRLNDGLLEEVAATGWKQLQGIVRVQIPDDGSVHDGEWWVGVVALTEDGVYANETTVFPVRDKAPLSLSLVQREAGRQRSDDALEGASRWELSIRDQAGRPVQGRVFARVYPTDLSPRLPDLTPHVDSDYPNSVMFAHNDSKPIEGYGDRRFEGYDLKVGRDDRLRYRRLDKSLADSLRLRASESMTPVGAFVLGSGRTGLGPYDEFARRRLESRELTQNATAHSPLEVLYLPPLTTDGAGMTVWDVRIPDARRDWQLEVIAIDKHGRSGIVHQRLSRIDPPTVPENK